MSIIKKWLCVACLVILPSACGSNANGPTIAGCGTSTSLPGASTCETCIANCQKDAPVSRDACSAATGTPCYSSCH